jgi:hypothetical protein
MSVNVIVNPDNRPKKSGIRRCYPDHQGIVPEKIETRVEETGFYSGPVEGQDLTRQWQSAIVHIAAAHLTENFDGSTKDAMQGLGAVGRTDPGKQFADLAPGHLRKPPEFGMMYQSWGGGGVYVWARRFLGF